MSILDKVTTKKRSLSFIDNKSVSMCFPCCILCCCCSRYCFWRNFFLDVAILLCGLKTKLELELLEHQSKMPIVLSSTHRDSDSFQILEINRKN